MKIHPLIETNFTPEEIQTMINQSSIHYDEDSQDVDYFLFSIEGEDGMYVEVRTDKGKLEIIDCSLQDTEDEEMDTSMTKERLFELLASNKTKYLEQLDVD